MRATDAACRPPRDFPLTMLMRRTVTDEVRERLADEILLGGFAPGMRLDEHSLAARYGVSRTPVREALKQLVVTGMVEARPHKGVFVAQVTPERLEAMFEAMADLEGACAAHAAARMTAAQRDELARVHETSRAAVHADDGTGYDALNRRFHGLILDGCRNEYLVEAVVRLRARTTPYRRAQFRHRLRLEHSFAEHQPILDAILAGDGAAASGAMRRHVAKAGDTSAELFARSATIVGDREIPLDDHVVRS